MGFYFDFESADAFAAGAIGNPGERVFYLQVRAEGRTVSMKCEKEQVAELARFLRGMLADLPEGGEDRGAQSATLQNPVEQDFVVGSIGLGIDRPNARMVLQFEEMVLLDGGGSDADDFIDVDDEGFPDDDDDQPTAVVRVLLTAAQARAFCDVAESVVRSGREVCALCGQPKDPSRHACPRMN